ncbi:hypothetical protein, partial [Pedobacter jejuensis]
FFSPKIIFQEMVQESSFMLDNKGEFMCLDTARIITGNDLDIIISVLNSKLFFYAIKTFYGGGGLGENGVRMKHTFFENFPMPNFSDKNITDIKFLLSRLSEESLDKIDKIIFECYGIEENEIKHINN